MTGEKTLLKKLNIRLYLLSRLALCGNNFEYKNKPIINAFNTTMNNDFIKQII
jgi:hypothetical protein